MIEVFTDGRAEPNPGLGTYGFVIYKDGARIDSGHGVAGKEVSNNYAEYYCLTAALERLASLRTEEIVVFSDSSLLVHQMSGKWKFKGGNYAEMYLKAKEMARAFPKMSFFWIPREKNREADELTNIAFAQARGW